MNKKTVILAGSGHAHLEVIKSLTKKDFMTHHFYLISPHKHTYYSGLIPRLIFENIGLSSLTIPSAAYAESKGLIFIQDTIQNVDPINNTVLLSSGKNLSFDILSLNVGCTAINIPTQSPESTIQLRPIDNFISQWINIQNNPPESENSKFVVVGGGAAAVEIATALRLKYNCEVHLVTQSSRLCENYSIKISTMLEKSLIDLNIQIHFNEAVNKIGLKSIQLKNGNLINFKLIFIAIPTRPSELIRSAVNSKLQHSSHIFSVGDGTTHLNHPKLPRSGVIAVHQGRYLAKSIKKLLANQSLPNFKIPSKQINILITGQKSAHLIWGNFCLRANWTFRLKKWIDERYVRQFKPTQ